jgi:predicted RNase H-like nuclease
MGGGVQPANRGKVGMFDNGAPIWSFLTQLAGEEDPEGSRQATHGLFYFEVFPALALASMHSSFFGRSAGPRYNPGRRKTFKQEDWIRVVRCVASEAERYGLSALQQWCNTLLTDGRPSKAHQDCLDAAICLLVALRWRLDGQERSIMIGDLTQGYMVSPIMPEARAQIQAAASRCVIAVDGLI